MINGGLFFWLSCKRWFQAASGCVVSGAADFNGGRGDIIKEICITWIADVCDAVVVLYHGVHLKVVGCGHGKLYIDNFALVEG